MTTPAWQPQGGQPLGGPQGHRGASNAPASHQQGSPHGPPFIPPTTYSATQPATGPSFGNASQLNSGLGNSLVRPMSTTVTTQGAQYMTPQSGSNYSMPPSSYSGTRWPPQQAGPTPGSTAAVPRPTASEGVRSGMSPTNLVSQGLPQAVQSASGSTHQPPYQVYPSNVGPGPSQQMGPPWMQPVQSFQRPPYMQYPGNYPGAFHGQQMRPLGPPNGMPPGLGPSVGPGFGLPGSVQPPVAWGQGPSGTSAGRPPLVMGDSGVSNGTGNINKPGPGPPGGSDPTGSMAGSKLEKGSSQVVVEPADIWTAHKAEGGAVYYYNSVTGQSTYTRPEGFTGEADKVTNQPTPVSWERLSATDWALVMTNDAKKYYYNTKTQATSWQIPPEVAELRKKQEDSAPKSVVDGPSVTAPPAEKSPVSFTLHIPAAITGGREAVGHKSNSNSALDLIKKKLQDSGAPVTVLPAPGNVSGVATTGNGGLAVDVSNGKSVGLEGGKEKLHKGDHASSDESSDSEEEDPGLTKEQKIAEFKEMLKEKGVAPFSKWEKELPKIIFDLRFKAIPSHTERRSIFEHYVRTRADVERREKRAAQKAAIEGFKLLLEEAAKEISHATTYDSFSKVWSDDPRFEALERKDRESLLNDRVGPLRKAEEDRVRAEHAGAVAGFRSLLSEKGEITSSSRWSKVKESLRSDPRYKVVEREEREDLFNAIVAELRAAELEVERAARAKKEEEEKLKEKEREVRKRKEREEQELERVRVKARRKDAVSAYQALLTEKIRDAEASWTEARQKLEKDPLSRASNPDIDAAEMERIFREHVDELHNRCVREYRLLLSEVITSEAGAKQGDEGKSIMISWHEAKKVLKSDPRYSKMPRRDRESLWRRHSEDVQRRLKAGDTTGREDINSGRAASPTRGSTDHKMRSPARRSRR